MNANRHLPVNRSVYACAQGAACGIAAVLPLLVLFSIVVPRAATAQDAGYVQIQCQAGVQIFFDGQLKGVTNSDVGGLILQDVPAGEHEVKAVKEGYQPVVQKIRLEPGKVLLLKFEDFRPKMQIEERGKSDEAVIKAKVGAVVIQTVPIECQIECQKLGIQQSKKKDEWILSDVPEGDYAFRLTQAKGGKQSLELTVKVVDRQTEKFLVNFLTGQVTDLGAQERARKAQEEKEARERREAERKMAEEKKLAEQKRIEEERKKEAEERLARGRNLLQQAREQLAAGDLRKAESAWREGRDLVRADEKLSAVASDLSTDLENAKDKARAEQEKLMAERETARRDEAKRQEREAEQRRIQESKERLARERAQRRHQRYMRARPGGEGILSWILPIAFAVGGIGATSMIGASGGRLRKKILPFAGGLGIALIVCAAVAALAGVADGWLWICLAPVAGLLGSGLVIRSAAAEGAPPAGGENESPPESVEADTPAASLLSRIESRLRATSPAWAGGLTLLGILCLVRLDVLAAFGILLSAVILMKFSDPKGVLRWIHAPAPNRWLAGAAVGTLFLWVIFNGLHSVLALAAVAACAVVVWKGRSDSPPAVSPPPSEASTGAPLDPAAVPADTISSAEASAASQLAFFSLIGPVAIIISLLHHFWPGWLF